MTEEDPHPKDATALQRFITQGSVRQDLIDIFAKQIVSKFHKNADKPIEQMKNMLPSTADEVRDLPFYESTLEAVRYQRDNYLVGTTYAERRTRQRPQGIHAPPLHRITYYPNALANIQLLAVGASFIPSQTVQKALLPIVVGLPSGVLRDPITNAVANAIPLAQPQLDRAVKNSVLAFMGNPHWRQVIKNRAGGYMGSRDAPRG